MIPFFKLLITVINIPRLFLHLIVFKIFIDKCKDDVIANINQYQYNCGLTIGFLYLIVFDKPFRNLFYFRIGKLKYLLWYFAWPHPCFTLATDMRRP